MGVEHYVEFFYRRSLTKQDLAAVVGEFRKFGFQISDEEIKKAWKEFQIAYRNIKIDSQTYKINTYHYTFLTADPIHLKDVKKAKAHLAKEEYVEHDPYDYLWFDISLDQTAKEDKISKITISTKTAGLNRWDWRTFLFRDLCDDLYLKTKPLVVLSRVEDGYDFEQVEKFVKKGDLKNLIAKTSNPFTGDAGDLTGTNPSYLSPQALRELKGIEFHKERMIKLSDGGLKTEPFEMPILPQETKTQSKTVQQTKSKPQLNKLIIASAVIAIIVVIALVVIFLKTIS